MYKRLLTTLLIISMMLIILVTPASAIGFSDMKADHWAYNYVIMLTGKGIINGNPDGTFDPEGTINADAFIKMAVVLKGFKLQNGSPYWASTFIAKAKEIGLVLDNEFDSYERPITRAEMARIVVRSLNESYPEDISEYRRGISDIGAQPEFSEYILKAYVKGIITGYTDGTFKGANNATRAEAAAIIARMLDQSLRKVPQKPGPEVYNGITLPSDEQFMKSVADLGNSSTWNYKVDMDNRRLLFTDIITNATNYLTGSINPDINKQVFALAKLLIGDGHFVSIGYSYNINGSPDSVTFSFCKSAKDQWDNGCLFGISLYDNIYGEVHDTDIFSKSQFGSMLLKRLCKEPKADTLTLFDLDGEVLSKLHDSMHIIFGKQTGEDVFNTIVNEYIRVLNTDTIDRYVIQVDNVQLDFAANGTRVLIYFSNID